jgi:hypothetical protein
LPDLRKIALRAQAKQAFLNQFQPLQARLSRFADDILGVRAQ